MMVVFQTGQRYVTWNLPIVRKEDEEAVIEWAVRNKVSAEGINGVAQLVRLLQGIRG